MKKVIFIFSLGILIGLQGCIPTVHPLYTEDTIVHNDLLEGEWLDMENDSAYWKFKRGGDHYYLVQDDGRVGEFDVYLVELDGSFYLDFYPSDLFNTLNDAINDFLSWHAVPMHIFAKVEIKESEIHLWFFDPDFIEDLLEQRKIKIKHERLDDGFLITASSEELQKFVIKYGHLEDAYMDSQPTVLRRIES